MDIEEVVGRFLANRTRIKTFLEVPKDKPDEFLSVELIGGGGSFLEPALLDVDCWAETRKRAKTISKLIQSVIPDLDDENNLFHPTVENVYRMNDPDSGKPRYVVSIQVWICE